MSICKGALKMTNIKLKKATTSLNYSSSYSVPSIGEHDFLENKLAGISNLVNHSLFKIKGYIFNNLIKENNANDVEILDLLTELKLIEDWFERKGEQQITDLKKELNTKSLMNSDMERLNSILNDHKNMIFNLLNFHDHLTHERSFELLRYVKELPYYLEFDLNLKSLRNKKSIKRTIVIKKINQEVKMNNSYHLKVAV